MASSFSAIPYCPDLIQQGLVADLQKSPRPWLAIPVGLLECAGANRACASASSFAPRASDFNPPAIGRERRPPWPRRCCSIFRAAIRFTASAFIAKN